MPDEKSKETELRHGQRLDFSQKIATNPGKKNVTKDVLIGAPIPITKEEK